MQLKNIRRPMEQGCRGIISYMIILNLMDCKKKIVNKIAKEIGKENNPKVGKYCKIMDNKILKSEKKGSKIYYSLNLNYFNYLNNKYKKSKKDLIKELKRYRKEELGRLI